MSCNAFTRAPAIVVFSAAPCSNSSDVRGRGFARALTATSAPTTSKTKNPRPIQSPISLNILFHPLKILGRIDADRRLVHLDDLYPRPVLNRPELFEHLDLFEL